MIDPLDDLIDRPPRDDGPAVDLSDAVMRQVRHEATARPAPSHRVWWWTAVAVAVTAVVVGEAAWWLADALDADALFTALALDNVTEPTVGWLDVALAPIALLGTAVALLWWHRGRSPS